MNGSSLRNPRLWVAGLSAAAVFYVVIGHLGRKSPGEVTAVHARDPGGRSCASCHGGWFSGMTESCLDCHATIDAQLDLGLGLHGALGRGRIAQCALCHSEHHGADFAMINRASFALAGVDSAEFDHSVVGFEMGGRHRELRCEKCHANAEVAVLPEGGVRFGGLQRDCSTCHEDAHQGRYVLACASCHGQEAFDRLESIGHAEHLELEGGHADVACRTCHAQGEPHALEALGLGGNPRVRECADCHRSPHGTEFVAGVARLASTSDGTACGTCHEPAHQSFSEPGLEVSPESHACSGFVLDAPHDEAGCADCHAADKDEFAARYPGRGQDDCKSCHEDPHGGQFDDGPFAEAGCVACHDRLQWEPHAFTVEQHEHAALPLTGSHLELECEECHADPQVDSPRVFRGTPSSCERCHDDAHDGYFDRLLAELADEERSRARRSGSSRPPSGEHGATGRGATGGGAAGGGAVDHGACARCHQTTSFSEIPPEGFDHGQWTGFALVGAHAQQACESCHARSDTPDPRGRTFGIVAERYGNVGRGGDSCVSCHEDPHDGDFDGKDLPWKVDGRIGCQRCHVETSFRAFPAEFDHGRWTGFLLDGAHEKADCSVCHAPLRQPEASGRTWERALGRQCSACHHDSHDGQFEVAGKTDCRRCHRSAVSFAELTFRHNLDSRFRLGEAHEKLACSACHHVVESGGAQLVRYRPLPTKCVDCHGAHDEPLRRRKGKRQ